MSKGGGSQTTSSSTQLPVWVREQAQSNLGFADMVAARPFEQYEGATVAPLDQDQILAGDYIRGNLGKYSGSVDEGLEGLRDLSTSAQKIMNPYLEDVEGAALTAFGHEAATARNKLAESSGHAFGGERFGVAEGVLGGTLAEKAAGISAGIRSAGWDKAIAGALASSTGLISGATAGQNIADNAATKLYGVGAVSQAQTQAEQSDLWRRWQAERDYPIEQLQILQQALSATPYPSSTTSKTPTTQNVAGNVIGALGTAATVASLFF